MSESKLSPRIRRRQKPKFYFAHSKYRPYLFKDFEDRCGYSMVHYRRAGGKTGMEVDHYNPHGAQDVRNRYDNLILATAHCNGRKSQFWPSDEDKKKGIRIINPCEEADYGHQIFEDPITFELWGTTPAAIFHIRRLALNAPHLVEERQRRFQIRLCLKGPVLVSMKGIPGVDDKQAAAGARAVRQEVEDMIPLIPQKVKIPPVYKPEEPIPPVV